MSGRLAILTSAAIFTLLMAIPAHVRGLPQVTAEDHAQHHPAAPVIPAPDPRTAAPATATPGVKWMGAMANTCVTLANDAELNELVKKMNAAQGQAKVDAVAELLTALVQDHRTMRGGMEHMMSTMQMRGGMHAGAPASPQK
jgi:hypothetical protein